MLADRECRDHARLLDLWAQVVAVIADDRAPSFGPSGHGTRRGTSETLVDAERWLASGLVTSHGTSG
jgi:hypothetical protein